MPGRDGSSGSALQPGGAHPGTSARTTGRDVAADVRSRATRTPRARLLVVEDEPRLRSLLRLYLERAGYEVSEAGDGRAALEAFDADPPDLLVVDLMLPRLQGEALIRAIRELSDVPILIASAKRSDVERIAGLRLGADDYLPKPYNVHELVERVHAILRRSGRARPDVPEEPHSFGGGRLTIDPATRAFTCEGREGRLTPSEMRVVAALVRASGTPLPRDELLRLAAGAHAETARTIDVHVGNLRRKLGDDAADPWIIETIPEVGYRWIAPADVAMSPGAESRGPESRGAEERGTEARGTEARRTNAPPTRGGPETGNGPTSPDPRSGPAPESVPAPRRG